MIDMPGLLLADKNLRFYRRLFERRYSVRILRGGLRLRFNICQTTDAGINQTESGVRYVSGRGANVTQTECFGFNIINGGVNV
jgi:hypothetical protein